MRRIISSIPALLIATLVIWAVGVFVAVELNQENAVTYARVAAGVPILLLFVRKSIRLGRREDYEPTYTLEDANVHWTRDNQGAFTKAYKYIEQLDDSRAKRVGVVLTIVGVVYYFVAPLIVDVYDHS